MMIQRLLLLMMTMILAPVTSSTLQCSTPDHGTVLSPACVSSDQLRSSENIVTLTNTTRDPGRCAQVNDHLVGYGTSHSASSSTFHHLALLVLLVALVSCSSNFHHWPLLALLVALVLH